MPEIPRAYWYPRTTQPGYECAVVSAKTEHLDVQGQVTRGGHLTYLSIGASRTDDPRFAEFVEAELTRELLDAIRDAGAAVPKPDAADLAAAVTA